MPQRTKKRYTREFKESSAKLAIDSDQSLSQTALDLGVNKVTLSTWVKKYASTTKTDPLMAENPLRQNCMSCEKKMRA